jgi:hypothetical protein
MPAVTRKRDGAQASSFSIRRTGKGSSWGVDVVWCRSLRRWLAQRDGGRVGGQHQTRSRTRIARRSRYHPFFVAPPFSRVVERTRDGKGIEPSRVARIALENAVSVASVLLLAEATLTEIPEPTSNESASVPRHACGMTDAGGRVCKSYPARDPFFSPAASPRFIEWVRST